jgi:hypothetical protein
MKTGIFIGSVLFVAAVVIGVVQLWFTPWRPDIFLKLELTVGAAFIIDIVICLVIREYTEDKANRGGDHLN